MGATPIPSIQALQRVWTSTKGTFILTATAEVEETLVNDICPATLVLLVVLLLLLLLLLLMLVVHLSWMHLATWTTLAHVEFRCACRWLILPLNVWRSHSSSSRHHSHLRILMLYMRWHASRVTRWHHLLPSIQSLIFARFRAPFWFAGFIICPF